jgi:hypothetical protein
VIRLDPPGDFVTKDGLIAAVEYLEHYAWRNRNVGVRELADHAPLNYVSGVMNE